MLKIALLASTLAAIAMGTNISVGGLSSNAKELDAKVIVEVDRDLSTLTEEGVSNVQRIVLQNIRNKVGSASLITNYSKIANAFAISVNTEDIELIKEVPGVKSVTNNKLHWGSVETQSVKSDGGEGGEYGDSENISATTMKLPEDNNEGEGTIIAILDNEFFFRGSYKEGSSWKAAWNHETFSALPTGAEGVAVKWKARQSSYYNTHAGKMKGTTSTLGREGSSWFNTKVPYYFDYGGETYSHSEDYNEDFDVSSTISYHGSHVASIASGNADTYKGIAPKAQLVCMKVFTNYKASETDKLLGFQNSSGAYDIPIMNALEDCMILGVDGINMSLGSNLDDFDRDSITMKTLQKLTEQGIMTSISAGNSGKASYESTGAYANWTRDMTETGILSGNSNVPGAMTIASGQPEKLFYQSALYMAATDSFIAFADQIVNSDYSDIQYDVEYKMSDLIATHGENLPWQYIPGFGTAKDYQGLSVDGKIAVVNRGSTSFADKYALAKSNGAIAIAIINNDPTANDFNFRCSFGDGFKPTMPCCLILYKDKGVFESQGSGVIKMVKNESHENPNQYTVSTFSSDGATYDLDLKPEITAPGDNIRGAIPPQKSEDQTEERKYKVYEYLSGTSMSAPNYAGAQSVVLSEVTKDIYSKYKTGSSKPTTAELQKIAAYRNTVDMRLMSTADPMLDTSANDEDGKISITSPRRQGAGMANIGDALETEVYLAGYDGDTLTKKSKASLRNDENINKGIIDFKFHAYSDATENRVYQMKLSVMRPSIAKTQDIITSEYNDRGEVDNIKNFPGYSYWVDMGYGSTHDYVQKTSLGTAETNDVFTVTRDIEYYASREDIENGIVTKIVKGKYYNVGTAEAIQWDDLPTSDYMSVKDVEIANVDLGDVSIPAAGKDVTVHYELTADMKAKIAQLFDYGCYIEGYVTLESKDGGVDLSMPYMGYYSIFNEEGQDYSSAPVVEPFAFEKTADKIYPSQLVNSIAKSLVGKSDMDIGSMMVAGYVDPEKGLNTEKILTNDTNLSKLNGFHLLGTDADGNYYSNPSENLYLGNPEQSNTLLIQQFVMRSVKDNYFTITNKESGEVVYKSALEDMLFGDRGGKYVLYKSHVDVNYLSAGYVSHRAYACVPLYNEVTGKPFESGDYEIKFNYQLAATSEWVSKSYTLKFDSINPEIRAVRTNKDEVKLHIFDANLAGATTGKYIVDPSAITVNEDGSYYLTLSKERVEQLLAENVNKGYGSSRLYIKLTDKAYGKMGVLIRFGQLADGSYDLSDYTLVEHPSLTLANDFKVENGKFTIVEYDSKKYTNTPITLKGFVIMSQGMVPYIHDEVVEVTVSGCGGNIIATSILVSSIALASFVTLLIAKSKRKEKTLGGNENE